jgi:uncharacterized protein YukE
MSQFKTITEFNIYLSDNLKNIKLNEYFNLIQSEFYSNLDISFMDYFLELTNHENEFIVDHIKLQEYGVINNVKTSKDIKTRLNSLFLIENEDYLVGNVSHQLKSGKKYAKEYKLTPYAFKLCLIRSKNSKEYAKYYLLLEQVFKNYQEYQIMYQTVLLSGKDKKMDEMKAQIDELLSHAKKTTEQNNNLKETVNNIKEQNDDLKETINDLNDNVDDLNETVKDLNDNVDDLNDDINILHETVDDIKEAFQDTANRSVPDPSNENEKHEFILLQHKILNNEFKFIRGIQKYNDTKINNKYEKYNIIKREYNANPIQLFKLFKETIKEEYKIKKLEITNNKQLKNKLQLKKEIEKIKFKSNDIILQYNYTLNELLEKLDIINNERFNKYNEFKSAP